MKSKVRESTPDDPIYQEGAQVILQPLTSTPRPPRRTRRMRFTPWVFDDPSDLFDESLEETWEVVVDD